MVPAALRERLGRVRQPRCAARIATALWIALAVIVWNVVFDHALVVAGRQYLRAVGQAAQAGGSYVRVDEWMRPAVRKGLWVATASAGAVLVVGLLAVRLARRNSRPPASPARL